MDHNEADPDDILASLCEPQDRAPLQNGEQAMPRLEMPRSESKRNRGFKVKEIPARELASVSRGKEGNRCLWVAGILRKMTVHLLL
jgi:hypothetical protein